MLLDGLHWTGVDCTQEMLVVMTAVQPACRPELASTAERREERCELGDYRRPTVCLDVKVKVM